MSIFLFVLFIFGLFLGSFVGVLSDRLPNDKPVVIGRSKCDHCKKTLEPIDLIPLLSFVFLLGKCRYCKKKLSIWYPTVEILSACAIVGSYLFAVRSCTSPFSCIIYTGLLSVVFLSLVGLFISDFKYQILPDELIIAAFLVAAIIKALPIAAEFAPILIVSDGFFASFSVGTVNLLFFLCLVLLTKGRGMGIGDVKLSFFIGFFLSFPLGFVAIYLAFLTGGLIGMILLILGRTKLKSKIAFGPFLIFGTVASLVGNEFLLDIINRFF